MKKTVFMLLMLAWSLFNGQGQMAYAQNPDSLTFAVLGNSISTYYDYIPSGYAIYYTADREKNYGIQVGDTWWMQLSRLSGSLSWPMLRGAVVACRATCSTAMHPSSAMSA